MLAGPQRKASDPAFAEFPFHFVNIRDKGSVEVNVPGDTIIVRVILARHHSGGFGLGFVSFQLNSATKASVEP